MASLTGSTIAASYEQLLSLPDGGLNGNTLVAITDGDSSTAIGMKVATSKIEVIPASDDANAFEVSNAAGTAILTINSSTTSASLVQTVTTATSTPKALFIDTNTSGVAAQNSVGMHIDFDRTVAGSGTAAHNDIGIDLDVNSASLGTSSLVGMDIDVVGATSGTSTATGVNIAVGSADTNYALITSGGNVGIGVADPDETLEVSGDAKVSGNLYFYDTGGESISSNGSVLSIAGGAEIDLTATDIDINGAANISGALVIGGDVSMTQAGQAILHVNSTGDAAQLKLSALSGDGNYEWSIYSNNAADQFLIVDGSATRLVIDSDGFVGIGTTAPRSAQGYSGSILEIGSADDVALVLTSDDGEGGENMWEIGNNTSGVLQFVHSVAGDGSTGTKMVIDASGNVGIGCTPDAGMTFQVEQEKSNDQNMVFFKYRADDNAVDDDDTILLLSFGDDADATGGHFIEFQDANDTEMTGTIVADSGTATNNSVSDYRNKENISLITGGLEKIKALKPSYFNYKTYPNKIHEGFIAHEVQEAGIGYAVRGEKDAMKIDGKRSRDTYGQEIQNTQLFAVTNIIPQMVSAIKELSDKLDTANAKITALENA